MYKVKIINPLKGTDEIKAFGSSNATYGDLINTSYINTTTISTFMTSRRYVKYMSCMSFRVVLKGQRGQGYEETKM